MAEITKEYAEALFMLACEINSEREFLSSLEEISKVFEENTELSDFLCAPNIPFKAQSETIENIFSDSHHEYIVSFLLLMFIQTFLTII